MNIFTSFEVCTKHLLYSGSPENMWRNPVETRPGRLNWWVIIGPDSWTNAQPGAFDLQTFLKTRIALAASVTR